MLHPEIFTYFEDKDAWKKRFLRNEALSKEWDLFIDEPGPDVFQFPLFKEEFCQKVIEVAESLNKWTYDRHHFYPTTDMLLETLGINDIWLDIQDEYVMDAARHVYELTGDTWKKGNVYSENFIIRYSPEEQGHLSLHYDQSRISTNVALNKGFEGGGTYFSRHKALVMPKDVGYVTFHPGQITHKHGGRPVSKGTRYIIVSFINEDKQREEHIQKLEQFAKENGYYGQ